jgi:rSAM/selenodomain-associated transferase 2
MKLSVILPTLNEEKGIRETLFQVKSAGADEIIVVDGGSQDQTRSIASEIGCRILESVRGRAIQMNAGAEAAEGDVLLFLHADTLLPPEAREAIESALKDAQVVGGRFDIRLDRKGWLYRLVASMVNLRSRATKIATGDQAIFVRRVVFQQIGQYSEIPLMEDVDLSRRLKRAGRVACLRHQVGTSARRWEQKGPLRTIFLMWGLRFLYFMGVNPVRLQQLYLDVR